MCICETIKPNPLSLTLLVLYLPLSVLFLFHFKMLQLQLNMFDFAKVLSGPLHCSEMLTQLNRWPVTNLCYVLVEVFLSLNSNWHSLAAPF